MLKMLKMLGCATVFILSACGPDQEDCEQLKQASYCEEGVVYWLDSCGNLGEIKEQCECECLSEPLTGCKFRCVPTSDCAYIHRECKIWPDGCGGHIDCGDCQNDLVCDLRGRCVYDDH